MSNLRISRIRTTSNTGIRAEFTSSLDRLINTSNVDVEPILSTLPKPEVLDVTIRGDLLDAKVQPLTPFATYIVTFQSSDTTRFKSLNGDQFLLENGTTNTASIQGPSEPPGSIKYALIDYLKRNIYNIDGTNLVSHIIDSQDKTLSGALHDIGQSANDNYLDHLVEDERHTRGRGPFDRLNQEGAFEVFRVGLQRTGYSSSLSFSYDSFPSDIITLRRTDVNNERLLAGSGAGTFNNLVLTVNKSPVTKLKAVTIIYQDGQRTTYNVSTLGYQIKDSKYDTAYGSTLFTLEDNQFRLTENIFGTDLVLPAAGDQILVSYEYKSLGRQIDPDSVRVTQVLDAVREVSPPIINEFYLEHAPVVSAQDQIPTTGGAQFLDPRACVPFSEDHPAFTKEIEFRWGSLPATTGEYSVEYETGRVFVYGEEINNGTGEFPPAVTYKYRNTFDSRLDYTYDPETADLVASPLRELIDQEAKVSFDFEETLVPDVDYVADVHKEILNERIDNRLATLTSLNTEHTPITNVFRVINETTGEIYPVNRFNETTVFFSTNRAPRISDVARERANFSDISSELLLTEEEITNGSGIRVFKINLLNNRIISSTEDIIGSVFNGSASFSRLDLFENELYYDGQILTSTDNINKLTIGDYVIDYEGGIIYVGVPNDQNFDLGTINYKRPAIKTLNDHIISVSKLYHSINPNSNVTVDIDYTTFTDTEIFPSSFDRADERFLNGDTSLPYVYDSGVINVSDDVKTVRHIYDIYDLNNNNSNEWVDFGPGSTATGSVITVVPAGVNRQEEYTVAVGNTITVHVVSPGVEIFEVNSVIRLSDGAELWNDSGSFLDYTITLPGIGSPAPGDVVVVNYQLQMNGGATPTVDYNRGDYFVNYSNLADEILVSYEYGDNVLDFREGSMDEDTEYFVTYKVGALRDSLLANFGSLIDLPIMSSFDTSFPRESYRDALQGALQSFTKGPTIPAITNLVSSITKIDPEIVEAVFDVWSLGISSLYQNAIDYTGSPTLAVGKYDNGVLLDTAGQTVSFPMSSNLRLEEGTLEMWVIPSWDGLDNDATLTFSQLQRDGYNLLSSGIYIGSDSHNPTFTNGSFTVSRFDDSDPKGLPSAIFTKTGLFIYYDEDVKRWKMLVKDRPDGYHGPTYTGHIGTSGEFYNVKFIEGLGEPSDTLRSLTNEIEFVFKLDALDVASPDGYSTQDGYMKGFSFDGISFMSDDLHYLFDFADEKTKNRFSIYKDGQGYLNFSVYDDGRAEIGSRQYKVSTDISDWSAGEQHFISTTWKIDTFDRRDEMHLFVDGFEVPNVLRYGGRPIASVGDRFRTVKPEIVAGTIPKNILKGADLHTTAGSNIVTSPSTNFAANSIVPGDTIDILEVGFGTFGILAVNGNSLTLNSPVASTFVDARYSVNKFAAIVSDEVDLAANVAISILSSGVETELPGVRADFPSYTIEKNSQLQTVLTVLGPAKAGDQILIRTLGLNHRRCREKMYLWGNTQSVLKTQMPPPINLDEVKVVPIILPLTTIGPSNSVIVAGDFVAAGFVPTSVSNVTEGRTLEIRITGGNVDFTNPVQVDITGTSDGGVSETVLFTSPGIELTSNKWMTITDVTVTVTPITTSANSISFEMKEAYTITYPDGNSIFPIIRYSYQNNSGSGLSGDGSTTVTGGFFRDIDIGNTLVIESPASVAGSYEIVGRSGTGTNTVVLSPAPATAFTNGIYKIYNTTIGRSGFQNGFFTFELAGQVNTPYPLPQGRYEFDYSSYLEIPFDNVECQIIYVGSDFLGQNHARAVIDELRILSRQLTDVRTGESLASSQKSITTDWTSLRAFEPDSDTLTLIHFDTLPFTNDALFYKLSNKEFLQSADSINSEFGQSLVITERPYIVDNAGNLATHSEGTIEFWISPRFDTFNDPNERYYFDASSAVVEEVTSLTAGVVKVAGRASEILSIRLTTDTENTGSDFFVGGSLASDFQTIRLGTALPSQQTPVKVTYVLNGFKGDRISIFKDDVGFLTFNVHANNIDYQVRQPIFWQRDTWHRVLAQYKFNRRDSQDELRLFIDGRESGTIRWGQGFLFGSGIVFGQGISGLDVARIVTNIDFTDTINNFYLGSTFNKINLAAARFDNVKISSIARSPLTCGGMAVDENYHANLDIVLPVIEDLYTTYLMNFDQLEGKQEDFAILRDEYFGIFNFLINVIDSFLILEKSSKMDQVLRELIYALKPAQSKVDINIVT